MKSALVPCVLSIVTLASCATQKSVIEIPSCADRVEIEGQADRLSRNRFELDHTFDFAFSKTELSFEQGGRVREIIVHNNQPDPFRLFAGSAVGVLGVIFIGAAAYDVANGAEATTERTFYTGLLGTSLVALGGVAVLTGWHPSRRYTTLTGMCEESSSSTAPDASSSTERAPRSTLPDGVFER